MRNCCRSSTGERPRIVVAVAIIESVVTEALGLDHLDRRGAVTSISPFKSSGFPAYDTTLMNTMREWTCRSFIVLDCPMREYVPQ
jgi:hypothetical protein